MFQISASAFDVSDASTVCGVMSISWNGNNWASACNFNGGDFSNARVSSSQCGGTCAATPGCTNFAWTSYNGGTCWMKNNGATKATALFTGDYFAVCGVNSAVAATTNSPLPGSGVTFHWIKLSPSA